MMFGLVNAHSHTCEGEALGRRQYGVKAVRKWERHMTATQGISNSHLIIQTHAAQLRPRAAARDTPSPLARLPALRAVRIRNATRGTSSTHAHPKLPAQLRLKNATRGTPNQQPLAPPRHAALLRLRTAPRGPSSNHLRSK